jgi:hypothetical protein
LCKLVKGFTVLDHTQLVTSPLFHGLHAFFELADFGPHHSIAFQQTFVLSVLIGNLLTQLGHLRKAAITDPQALLQTCQQQEQNEEQPIGTAHRISGIQWKKDSHAKT